MTTTSDYLFYDTSSLLLLGEEVFQSKDLFLISSVTFEELESIKTAANKDFEIKYTARTLLQLFKKYRNTAKYTVVVHEKEYEEEFQDFSINNDIKILSDAYWASNNASGFIDSITFVTNDLSQAAIANLYFGDGCVLIPEEEKDTYTGYKEICPTDEELENFYSNPDYNWFDLLVNQYLILRDSEGKILELRAWTGETHRYINCDSFNSTWFGKVSPFKNDIYQKLLFDSLHNNVLTIIRGPAGIGKSHVALGFLLSQLEKNKIDKIVIFCNTVATKDTAKLGYYPGDKNSKLLDSQIGNFLIGKIGDLEGVQQLIEQNKLLLVPMSDCRGMSIDTRAGVYITEAQNTTIDTMQLVLQRIGSESICVVEGDDKTQVDMPIYQDKNNGLVKASKVFRGQEYYGEVTLRNCYRSEIAKRAELMR